MASVRQRQLKVYKETDRTVDTLLRNLRKGIYIPEEYDRHYVQYVKDLTRDFAEEYQNALILGFLAVAGIAYEKYSALSKPYVKIAVAHGIPQHYLQLNEMRFVSSLLEQQLPGGYTLSHRIWDLGTYSRDITQVVRNGLMNGLSPTQMSAQLDSFLLPGRHAIMKTPYGRTLTFDSYRLARSEITVSQMQADVLMAKACPWVDGLQWDLSPAHSILCECDDLAGQIFKPEYVPMPPHPLCQCSLTPIMIGKHYWDRAVSSFLEHGRDIAKLGIAAWLSTELIEG